MSKLWLGVAIVLSSDSGQWIMHSRSKIYRSDTHEEAIARLYNRVEANHNLGLSAYIIRLTARPLEDEEIKLIERVNVSGPFITRRDEGIPKFIKEANVSGG